MNCKSAANLAQIFCIRSGQDAGCISHRDFHPGRPLGRYAPAQSSGLRPDTRFEMPCSCAPADVQCQPSQSVKSCAGVAGLSHVRAFAFRYLTPMSRRMCVYTPVCAGYPGFCGRAVRHIIATDHLKRRPGDYPTVAKLLHDKLETVLREHSNLTVDEGLLVLHRDIQLFTDERTHTS